MREVSVSFLAGVKMILKTRVELFLLGETSTMHVRKKDIYMLYRAFLTARDNYWYPMWCPCSMGLAVSGWQLTWLITI